MTGGAGFIGSHLVDRLVGEGCDVVVLDNLSAGNMGNISQSKDRVEMVVGDIRDRSTVEKVIDGVQVVFHEAAQVNVRRSVEDPFEDLDINVHGSLVLLEECVKAGVEKVVYASSGGAVYGDPPSIPASEECETNPVSPYGASKLMVEKYLECYYEIYGLDYVVLRYGNVFGPRQDPFGEAGVISIFLSQVLKWESPVIFGDGFQTRDFVFVGDVVEANMKALRYDSFPRIFNIGSGVETSVNEIFSTVIRITGVELPPKYGPERKGEVKRIVLDISRAFEKLGWAPKTSLDEGIKKTWEWMQKQPLNI